MSNSEDDRDPWIVTDHFRSLNIPMARPPRLQGGFPTLDFPRTAHRALWAVFGRRYLTVESVCPRCRTSCCAVDTLEVVGDGRRSSSAYHVDERGALALREREDGDRAWLVWSYMYRELA